MAEQLLLELEVRGKDATGYVSIAQKGRGNAKVPSVTFERSNVPATEFVKTHRIRPGSHTVLLHTRAQTKGDAKVMENNHPVLLNSCYAVHNGMIHNDDEVIKEGLPETQTRAGEVDSFAIPTALEYHGWGCEADIKSSLNMLRGSFAIAAIDPINKPDRILLAKGESSPLHILHTPHGVFWASTKDALINSWGRALGTPPTATALRPDDFGFSDLNPGDYRLIDMSGERMVVDAGRFEINRSWPTQGQGGYGQYRRQESRDWTCWPKDSTKDCVFADDCNSCHNGDCECFENNQLHPRLNTDVTFKNLVDKYRLFGEHVKKYKLDETLICRPPVNPTTGATKTNTAGQSRTGSHPARVPATPGASISPVVTLVVNCFYCKTPHPTGKMRKVTNNLAGGDAKQVYECEACQGLAAEAADVATPIGHDIKLDVKINKYMAKARIELGIVDAAMLDTCWEFDIPIEFTQWAVLYCPAKTDSKDFQKFLSEIKLTFRANLIIHQEEAQGVT